MSVEMLQSHYCAARSHMRDGELKVALVEAELAVDQFWKDGDSKITQALPLLSLLRHASQSEEDTFESLDDLPTSFSPQLLSEATLLHEEHQSDASMKMMADVNGFIKRWVGEENQTWHEQADFNPLADDRIESLKSQITQFYSDGSRDRAIEASLELANEYANLGQDKRAFKLFRQVVEKSKRAGRTNIRIDGLLDFGQFMSRIEKLDDAERLMRLAAGVARKANDREKYAHVIAALGVVLMHQGKDEQAIKYLEKARLLLTVWGVDSDTVNQHLEALRKGVSCNCIESLELSFVDVDWD